MLEYFGEKESTACGACDICLANRSAGKENTCAPAIERLMQLLADGEKHNLSELESFGLTKNEMTSLLREVCDEELIAVDGDFIYNKQATKRKTQ